VEVKEIDAALLSKMFLAGAHNLESKKEYINELNVFPVPDGDTGTNMTMTILSAAGEVSALEDVNMKSLAKAISSGSLRGARGNSGVILSQLLRGFTKVMKEVDVLDVSATSEAFSKAVETAYKAVMKPKEGTILTVARVTAEKVAEVAQTTDDLLVLAEAAIKQAEETLETTPDLLPVLKEAGVVDSGGTGLLEFLRGCYDVLMGKEVDYASIAPAQTSANPMKVSAETEAEIKFGYCTEFIIVLKDPVPQEETEAFRDFLEGIGDSIVMVADDEIIKIHVHTNDPGVAITRALTYGSLSRIKIDNMREEHEERLIKDAAKIAAEQAAERASRKEEDTKEDVSDNAPVAIEKDFGFVAVSAGEGLSEIFESLGADQVITGGQTMNPSTEDIINAVNKVPAKNVFVLPNNKNIILAAEQAVYLAEDRNVIVIPSKTIPQGICALINFMEDSSAEENKARMIEELANVKTGELTYAVRDTTIEGTEIKDGQIMALGDSGLLGVGESQHEVLLTMLDKMVDDSSEIITLYYGADVSEADAGSLLDDVTARYSDCEVELYAGGQPVYYYIVSVE